MRYTIRKSVSRRLDRALLQFFVSGGCVVVKGARLVIMERGKRLVRFLLIVGILQGIFLIGGTESGLGLVFTGLVRVKAESYSPRQSANVVYYDMRLSVSEASRIAVALDFSAMESADAFLHFFRFVKQYDNVKTVFLANDAYLPYADAVSAAMDRRTEETDETDETDDPALPRTLAAYTEGLAAIYDTMQPVRKFRASVIASDGWREALSGADEQERVLVLCDRDLVMTAENRVWLAENDVFLWELKYDNCATENGIRSDIHLPFTGDTTGYYMMAMDRIDSFAAYYRRALNLFSIPALTERAGRLDRENAAYFCVITNGTNGPAAEGETETAASEIAA